MLAISSSGEFRDVIAAASQGAMTVAITANDQSALARHARASAVAQLDAQRSVTHTQGYAANVAVALALWADLTGDSGLRSALARSPDMAAKALREARSWAASRAAALESPRAAVAFGSGPAWAASLEAALLLKEVARIPAEGSRHSRGRNVRHVRDQPRASSTQRGMRRRSAAGGSRERVPVRAGATVIRLPGAEVGDPPDRINLVVPVSFGPGDCAG